MGLSGVDRSRLIDVINAQESVAIARPGATAIYTVCEVIGDGLQSVVWSVSDDLGRSLALKVITPDYYGSKSLYDEMTLAQELRAPRFAEIVHFGFLELPGFDQPFPCVVMEQVSGVSLAEWAITNVLLVDDFLQLVRQLLEARAELERLNLVHDDLHAGNVMISEHIEALSGSRELVLRIIDTGSIKRASTRITRLSELRRRAQDLEETGHDSVKLASLKELLEWKTPDDHMRTVELMLLLLNNVQGNYHRSDPWERRFIDGIERVIGLMIDDDVNRRLDSPAGILAALREVRRAARATQLKEDRPLVSPFDYPSSETILDDIEFAKLFSGICPWLPECQAVQPVYLYGPRGCGKSSVLRWLSFKVLLSDKDRKIGDLKEVGVYLSCSSELRSRFLLMTEATLEKVQARVIRFFGLLLLEELFDTLRVMQDVEREGRHNFGLEDSDLVGLVKAMAARIDSTGTRVRLQGQSAFEYLRGLCRQLRWQEWAQIRQREPDHSDPDSVLVSDVTRELARFVPFFKTTHVTFLLDDYSNQRIPVSLQRKLNQTISFAKQGTPLFKVSSEYDGMDLDGIQEGREVLEVNCGEQYTRLNDSNGYHFLEDILDRRLREAGYVGSARDILGLSEYSSFAKAIRAEMLGGEPFYYHGVDCVHQLCSGDLALALSVVKRLFVRNGIGATSKKLIPPKAQHETIQQFSHEEVQKIRYLVPFGEVMFDIVCYLGHLANATVAEKSSGRKDKLGEPVSKTHLDIRLAAVRELESSHAEQARLYRALKSKSVLFSLRTSRSRKSGQTEKLQVRRIYLPAFKAPLSRDVPIKVDDCAGLVSLLTNPEAFVERQLKIAKLDVSALGRAARRSEILRKEA